MMGRPTQPDRSRRSERVRTGLTGRRGFVVAASLGILSLYGLWSAYGAAPGLRLGDEADGEAMAGGHGAMDGGDLGAFRAEAEAFIERHRIPDGSVQPPGPAAATGLAGDGPLEDHGAHGRRAAVVMPGPVSAHGEAEEAPIEVYLLVRQWLFEPAVLRLAAGVPYRLRMLASDVRHGASLQLGFGSRIVRLWAGLQGLPQQVIDAGYDAAASPGWAVLMTLMALAGRVMAAGLLAYAGALAAASLRPRTREREIPVAAAPSPVGPTTPATAWSGPLAVLVLLVGMYAATAIAFELTQALPIAAVGAAGH